ncbi:uncharacterized protein LOC105213313 [Zeugodacus cucurbitae]|uniref:Protein-methionine sulfoxide oxidase MICAL3 n=1 Tax=Zeugodacus cucurbitae TaxID=28588 RepID=A0A0A1XNA0_ZEUCU|nr:uncharacterized protein LOC105213313 [Zeugodacus cucurbitae]
MDSIISNADDADQYRYISHVDFIRILRDKYKEGTKNTFESIKAQVEQECEKKKQKAEKATELLSHCRQALSQLDEQHEMIEKTLKQHTKLGKKLNEQIRQQKDSLTNDETAMRQLLHELRTHNA